MGLFGAAVGAAIGSAVKAASTASKVTGKKGSSSGSSSSSSSSGGATSSTSSSGQYKYGDITKGYTGTMPKSRYDEYDAMARNAAANWHSATSNEEKEYWHNVAVHANTALGRSYDDHTGVWSGGFSPTEESPYIPTSPKGNQVQGWEGYDDSALLKAYQEQVERQNAATQAAVQQGKLTLQQQLPGIQQSYDQAARQAYIQYMNAKKDLPQQLAVAGISGQGAAESTVSQQANAYGNVLSQSELARRNAEQQVQNQIANLEASGDLQYAQNASNINQSALSAYQNYLAQQQAAVESERNYALNIGSQLGYIGGVPTLGMQQQQNADKELNASLQAQAYDQQMQQYQQALQRWQVYGKVANAADAELLGVPVGTSTADDRYQSANIALNNYLAHRQ